MAYDLFTRRLTAANWARDTLTSQPRLPSLPQTPNTLLTYLATASDRAKATDVAVSKKGVKVTKTYRF
jgi:hypothetical protein